MSRVLLHQLSAIDSTQISLAGVNIGFGASADSRTKNVFLLQQALLQHTQNGVLTSIDLGTLHSCIDDLSVQSKPAP